MTCPGCLKVGREIAARPSCHTCKRVLHEGEGAWADDWTVIDEHGARKEIRYTCDTCATPGPWRCETHDTWTTSDCPRCDDELIALTEEGER